MDIKQLQAAAYFYESWCVVVQWIKKTALLIMI